MRRMTPQRLVALGILAAASASCHADGTAGARAAAGPELLLQLGHRAAVKAITYCPGYSPTAGRGPRLASAGLDGAVKVWDSLAGEVLCTAHTEAASMAVSDDGK